MVVAAVVESGRKPYVEDGTGRLARPVVSITLRDPVRGDDPPA